MSSVPTEYSEKGEKPGRGRPMDWHVSACFSSYISALDALRQEADARGIADEPGTDAAVRRLAWAAAQEAHPAPRTSVAYRCHQAGIPLPPRGRPPAAGVLVLPPVAVRRSGVALYDSAWVERVAQHLEPHRADPDPTATGKPLPAHVAATYAARAVRRAAEATRGASRGVAPRIGFLVWALAAGAAACIILALHP